ncbi:terminase large subunit domain-containing protein [Lichenihabitans psoromatis]|uniref:terminase large subunit domain-containing protein n=1 Tax=Lichenihabitans psoromatis TaxID=2528642 RepID=UPI0010383A6C|nr:terminase large subunit [Lichenihabitans psoromatis]
MTDWDLSCPDWEDRLRNGTSLVPFLPDLIVEQADRAVRIFDNLRIPDIPGTPRFEQAAGDWFRDIVRAMFGSYDPATNVRFIRELFLLVPKKNSKTTNGSGMMLTALLLNKRPNAEFLLVAPTQAISLLAFEQLTGTL